MAQSATATLSKLGVARLGAFRGTAAVAHGVTRRQLETLRARGDIERLFPDTFRMTAVTPTVDQRLHAALLWAGPFAVASGRSAGRVYDLEGVRPTRPELGVPRTFRGRAEGIALHRVDELAVLMPRAVRDFRVAGVEATLVRLAHLLDAEAFEVACEDARRRQLTSVPALRAYLERVARPGRRGIAPTRALLAQLDPAHPSRSTLEVRTRRLLVSRGLTGFTREHPLAWNGRTYRYDFAFLEHRAILETNGRRWHDDPRDFEHDQEKWSVPGRNGFRLVFATWDKVVQHPDSLIAELRSTLAAE